MINMSQSGCDKSAVAPQRANFMGSQMGPMLAPWTFLLGARLNCLIGCKPIVPNAQHGDTRVDTQFCLPLSAYQGLNKIAHGLQATMPNALSSKINFWILTTVSLEFVHMIIYPVNNTSAFNHAKTLPGPMLIKIFDAICSHRATMSLCFFSALQPLCTHFIISTMLIGQ